MATKLQFLVLALALALAPSASAHGARKLLQAAATGGSAAAAASTGSAAATASAPCPALDGYLLYKDVGYNLNYADSSAACWAVIGASALTLDVANAQSSQCDTLGCKNFTLQQVADATAPGGAYVQICVTVSGNEMVPMPGSCFYQFQ